MKRKNGLFNALALSILAMSGNSIGSKTKIDYTPCKYNGMTNQELGTKKKKPRSKR